MKSFLCDHPYPVQVPALIDFVLNHIDYVRFPEGIEHMIWHVWRMLALGTLCKGVIFDLLVSTGRSVCLPVILDAEGHWVRSRTLTPSSLHTIDYVGKNDGYHRKPDGLPSMCLCWWVNVCVDMLFLHRMLPHILFLFVSLHIFTAVHGSAFLGHFPQLQSNFDTSTIGDGAESSRLVLFDVFTNIPSIPSRVGKL